MPPKARGKNWTEEEQLHLMDIMEEVFLISPDDWEVVQGKHKLAYPYNRSIGTLQHVLNDLARVTEPT